MMEFTEHFKNMLKERSIQQECVDRVPYEPHMNPKRWKIMRIVLGIFSVR